MLRRGERAVVGGAIAALVLAALAGVLSAPARDIDDPRLSTYLAGPNGAKGLAQTLERLHMTVDRRRRPYFDLVSDSVAPRQPVLLAFLDVSWPTARERVAIRDYVGRGGRIFVAGVTGIESCFGYRSARDSAAVQFAAPQRLPYARRLLVRLPAESLAAIGKQDVSDRCPPRIALRVDTLLRTVDNRPIALRLRFASGGEAILLADGRLLSNRALKETDAGLAVLPWFLGGPHHVLVDEYHQGFAEGGSLPGAAWAWLWSHPLGWAILQLIGVALVALAVQAVRFGPARHVIERRRRSPVEHLEALAAGLKGADGFEQAIHLLVMGLRRRLSRTGSVSPDGEQQWLGSLALTVPTARGRAAARQLQDLGSTPGGAGRVLAAAQSVEDVWEELRPRTTRDRS